MFYSNELLSKTGPLAKIWLASNVEKKLGKKEVIGSNIPDSVSVILDQARAPLALRMSAQLMLGVVRVYGRKARYLLDDCNDALYKTRMTFRATHNHDLTNQATTAIDLNLPEALTIDELFPALDFGLPLTQLPATQQDSRAADYDDDWTSSLNPHSQNELPISGEAGIVEADDIILDLGDDFGMDTTVSVQYGRKERTPLADNPDDLPAWNEDDDLAIDIGQDVPMTGVDAGDDLPAPDLDGQVPAFQVEGDETVPLRDQPAQRADSQLSDAHPGVMQDPDNTFQQIDQQDDVEDQVVVAAQQRSRKQKPMIADRETVLHNHEIKAFAADRSKILKPVSAHSQDPYLLALIQMQKSGSFAKDAMNDGRSRSWAPEIQGLLTFDAVQRASNKRKRDSGIADVHSDDEHSDKSPRMDRTIAQIRDVTLDEDEGVEINQQSSPLADRHADDQHVPIGTDNHALADMVQGEDEEGIFPGDMDGGFDDTTMPHVHPADSGPVSLSTKRAVHLLRETFGSEPDSESTATHSRKHITLQDLIPEAQTSREDATKMFFETLVLATKDAIKVDQGDKKIGLPIRVRAKRGLWGTWAETTQADQPSTQDVLVSA